MPCWRWSRHQSGKAIPPTWATAQAAKDIQAPRLERCLRSQQNEEIKSIIHIQKLIKSYEIMNTMTAKDSSEDAPASKEEIPHAKKRLKGCEK